MEHNTLRTCRHCHEKTKYLFSNHLCKKCASEISQCQRALKLQSLEEATVKIGTLPAQPTPAQPGTAWKVRVMASRRARWETLFHPKDGDELDPREGW